MKFIYIGVATSLLLTIAAGCSPDETQDETSNELTVAAASDLHRAFSEIGVAFEKETGTPVTFSFGSTGQLADQIENGAPFDVFAAANIEFIDRLDDQDMLVDGTKELYAIGRIGIVYHEDSSFTAEEINQLDSDEINQLDSDEIKRLSIANPEHAPYGLAAKEALESAGMWNEMEGKLVYGRNISDALSFVESGNAEAGIVALSLAPEEDYEFHLIDESLHNPLEQAIAVIDGTNAESEARNFLEFIKGPTGKPIMENYGFVVPEENQ